jgi:hypothetical protein
MTLVRLPGNKIVSVPPHTGDHVFNLAEYPEIDESISKESVPVIGNWEDYTGSGTIPPQEVMTQGLARDYDVTLATVGKSSVSEYDEKGKRITTHRSRDRLVTVES